MWVQIFLKRGTFIAIGLSFVKRFTENVFLAFSCFLCVFSPVSFLYVFLFVERGVKIAVVACQNQTVDNHTWETVLEAGVAEARRSSCDRTPRG
jgi:hypothetical protein